LEDYLSYRKAIIPIHYNNTWLLSPARATLAKVGIIVEPLEKGTPEEE